MRRERDGGCIGRRATERSAPRRVHVIDRDGGLQRDEGRRTVEGKEEKEEKEEVRDRVGDAGGRREIGSGQSCAPSPV